MRDAALLAARCLLKAGTFPADPLDMLRRCAGVMLYTEEELRAALGGGPCLSPEEDARVYRYLLKDGRVMYGVCYRADTGESRQRFSLAHELGHIALRHGVDPDADEAVCRREEKEAHAFAAALLVPSPLVAVLQRDSLTPAKVSAIFGVSHAMARLALSGIPERIPESVYWKLIDRFGPTVIHREEQVNRR